MERVRRTAQARDATGGGSRGGAGQTRTAQAHDAAGNQEAESGLGAVRRRRTRHAARKGRRARMAAEERVLPVLLVPVSAEARGRLGPGRSCREQAALGSLTASGSLHVLPLAPGGRAGATACWKAVFGSKSCGRGRAVRSAPLLAWGRRERVTAGAPAQGGPGPLQSRTVVEFPLAFPLGGGRTRGSCRSLFGR